MSELIIERLNSYTKLPPVINEVADIKTLPTDNIDIDLFNYFSKPVGDSEKLAREISESVPNIYKMIEKTSSLAAEIMRIITKNNIMKLICNKVSLIRLINLLHNAILCIENNKNQYLNFTADQYHLLNAKIYATNIYNIIGDIPIHNRAIILNRDLASCPANHLPTEQFFSRLVPESNFLFEDFFNIIVMYFYGNLAIQDQSNVIIRNIYSVKKTCIIMYLDNTNEYTNYLKGINSLSPVFMLPADIYDSSYKLIYKIRVSSTRTLMPYNAAGKPEYKALYGNDDKDTFGSLFDNLYNINDLDSLESFIMACKNYLISLINKGSSLHRWVYKDEPSFNDLIYNVEELLLKYIFKTKNYSALSAVGGYDSNNKLLICLLLLLIILFTDCKPAFLIIILATATIIYMTC